MAQTVPSLPAAESTASVKPLVGLDPGKMPRHVAMIMDGNGRWAKARGRPRSDGHREGAKAVRRVVTRCRELGVPYLTLYAFSAQNWRRPQGEIDQLMALLIEFCEGERSLLVDKQIKFNVIGQRQRLPEEALQAVSFLEELTSDYDKMRLTLALSYGGREELVDATKRLAEDVAAGRLSPQDVDQEQIRSRLWTHDMPDPDLVVRSSGELRVSNFLLWQIAYAELVTDKRMWPEFDADAFDAALLEFGRRQRRFGAV